MYHYIRMQGLLKKILVFGFCFLFCSVVCLPQTDPALATTSIPIEMLFPDGKSKALILSYDDGRAEDRQLVELMNKYGLIGTFHLNSNKLSTEGYLHQKEVKSLFAGHEVSVHSANHPNLNTLSKADVVYEVVEDRKGLERLVGYPVRGMAYPFGNHNDRVVAIIEGLGIEYARTAQDTEGFAIPENFLKWHPTIHQFAKAYFKEGQPETDRIELAKFYTIIDAFLKTETLALLDVWGHSWELGNRAKWAETERFFQRVANTPAIHYTTHIALVDYILAYRQLKFSVDKKVVLNQSALTVWFSKNGQVYSVLPGKMLLL